MPVYFGATHGPQRRHPEPEVKSNRPGPDFSLTHPKPKEEKPWSGFLGNQEPDDWEKAPKGYTFAYAIKPGDIVVIHIECMLDTGKPSRWSGGNEYTHDWLYKKVRAVELVNIEDLPRHGNRGWSRQPHWRMELLPGDPTTVNRDYERWPLRRGDEIYVLKSAKLKPEKLPPFPWDKRRD